jgi:hypothetical protein
MVRMPCGFPAGTPTSLHRRRPVVGRARRRAFTDPRQGGPIMSKDSTSKANVKKKGKTIKEKQAAKRLKRTQQNGHASNIPSTGH